MLTVDSLAKRLRVKITIIIPPPEKQKALGNLPFPSGI